MNKRWASAFEAAKGNPTGVYRFPDYVLRDRRFNDQERLEILDAWEKDENVSPRDLPEIRRLIAELKDKPAPESEKARA
jgi:hypothetical protein